MKKAKVTKFSPCARETLKFIIKSQINKMSI